MPAIDLDKMDDLRRTWTDRFVVVCAERPELKRFEGKTGRVVTVNYSGKAIVDFADGAWYDIPAADGFLTPLAEDDPRCANYDSSVNSAQLLPEKQG